MKIAIVGPGIMPIPPNGWGAVEMMIWDYFNILKQLNIDVDIINTSDKIEIVNKINIKNYDIVHIHYDIFADLIKFLKPKVKIISSHYPYINNPEYYIRDNYQNVLPNIIDNKDFYIFASSEKDINTFVKFGANKDKIYLNKLGIKENEYNFLANPEYDKTLCFSQIVERKRQFVIQDIEKIDFMGRLDDSRFNNLKNYKGEVDRKFLNQEISKYSNFILISSVENTTPLAVKEALICGLGVVVSEAVAYELDRELDFISVIEEKYINDLNYIREKISENKLISIKQRNKIREYAVNEFGLESIIKNSYIPKLASLLNE